MEDDVILPGAQVAQHRVGDQHSASATATTVQGMGDLVPPGERAEIVAVFACRAQEADPDLIDAERVGAQRSRRLLGTEDLWPALHFAGVERQVSAALGEE